MKFKVFLIFGTTYLLLLSVLSGMDNIVFELIGWDPTADGIDNLLGLLFFVVAILLSMNRQAHGLLGGTLDSCAFRSVLSENRWSLMIGVVFITTIVNLAVALVSSSYMTEEMVWPSPLRTAVLSVVYGILARVIIVESVERMRYA
ncbi:hypothetical protein GAO09_27650 [Rhizobiales bacterium RZME27]|uniref:Uncharacterized protein n=1 Tax=Endobacterium cereale TaxID=2663029 RepID=A0A6A8AIZ4_9HYPH|nr:hypothetical protein [Endobacterium cereale]MEB2842936.1 hypothetical protein [Endobacterium cereale]MQY49807.1 hypothetical protein [Endobacterium cereale]